MKPRNTARDELAMQSVEFLCDYCEKQTDEETKFCKLAELYPECDNCPMPEMIDALKEKRWKTK